MSKRTYNTVTCAICGFSTKTNGIATHFKHAHNLSIDQYVKLHGEYRPKYINYQKNKDTEFNCKICNQDFSSERHLSYHLKEHGITKEDYVIKYILNGIIPKCKCGCGEYVKLKTKGSPPYWSDYISGHNTVITGVGMQRSIESKNKMRTAAIERLKNKNSVFYRAVSKNELEFHEFVNSIYDGEIIQNDTTVLSGLELDLYLPERGIAFEFNGDRFHSDLFKDKGYHLKKTKECADKGIRLIHIWMVDWNVRQDIIKSQIRNILGKTQNKIYARNCIIKSVSPADTNLFLEKNHLQGKVLSKHRYGLYYNDVLVQLITFGKFRDVVKSIGSDTEFELVRLCTKIDTIVVGGVSKLYKHFVKTHTPTRIISFANRDWSTGNVYESIGMKLVSYTEPGYFYSNGKRKEHRYNVQKHKLVELGYDSSKTEYEIMNDRGYYRIWDCGNIKYESTF